MKRVSFAACMALLLAACTTTSLKDTWKDPAFAGPPAKQVLVIGVAASDSSRRVFEDGFSAALAGAGSAGVPSYTLIPGTGAIPSERIDSAVKQSRADAILITRVLRVRRDVNVSPGYAAPGWGGMGYGGYYRGAYGAMAPDVHVYDVITIESTLWRTSNDKPVWSGTSEVMEPKNVAAATQDLAKVLIAKMKADGVL
jgi:hypothetical protein